ncbi:MAG: hypothetical protein HOO99_18250, partial [Hyphomicrobiaceae bacterium]|nr:hypothetical protein [Hyphomicrobiaceae bacterium]
AVGQSVANLYEHGARITLICTDTHAQLNGYSSTDSTRYFDAIRNAGARRGFECVKLSDLILNNAEVVAGIDIDELPPNLLPVLSSSAAKWHGGGLAPVDAAKKYYMQNMREKRAVECAFPDAIFITFNSSKHRPLFPAKMPIFYMYALKKGIAKKPWFLDENGDDPTFANDPRGSESGHA